MHDLARPALGIYVRSLFAFTVFGPGRLCRVIRFWKTTARIPANGQISPGMIIIGLAQLFQFRNIGFIHVGHMGHQNGGSHGLGRGFPAQGTDGNRLYRALGCKIRQRFKHQKRNA